LNPHPMSFPEHAARIGRINSLKARRNRDYSRVLAMTCPKCGSKPGEPCMGRNGEASPSATHVARARELWKSNGGA